jgi:hypothetical protein
MQGGGYDGGYREQQPLMQQQDYQQGGYPPQTTYPGSGGYPPQQGGYPPQGSVAPQTQYPGAGYPPQGSYPPGSGGYNPGGGMPPQTNYPGAGASMQTTTSMNLVFFVAACVIMVAALIDSICLLLSGDVLEALELTYLVIFGAILAVLDTPFFKTIKLMGDLRMYIGKYINLVTRVTGKGITFVFLGSTLFCTIVGTCGNQVWKVLAFFICAVPVLVGIAAIVIGIMKSQKLSKARQHLATGALQQRYEQYAQTFRGPQGGLTPQEFNGLTMENGGFKWEDADLKLIFGALVSNPTWRINPAAQQGPNGRESEPKIPREDLLNWVQGGMVWL